MFNNHLADERFHAESLGVGFDRRCWLSAGGIVEHAIFDWAR
jgi:hypothetical protein